MGSPRVIVQNLAIAYEHLESWLHAAEAWRALLRTRPRKNPRAKDQDDTEDAKWAWVRKRIVTCYKRADRPDEAVTIFRQMIKKSPEDTETRMQLAEALIANDQYQAGLNEIHRVLEIDPNHIDANIMAIELYHERHQIGAAQGALERLAQQQPANEQVRQRIASAFLYHGSTLQQFGQYQKAIKTYEDGRKIAPQDYRFAIHLARVAVEQNQFNVVTTHIDEALALAPDQTEAYLMAMQCWIVANQCNELVQLLERAEAAIEIDISFYADIATTIFNQYQHPDRSHGGVISYLRPFTTGKAKDHERKEWITLAHTLLNKAVESDPESPNGYRLIAAYLSEVRPDLALEYAEKAVEKAPDDPSLLILLGLLQGINRQTDNAQKTLQRAEHLAKNQGNENLVRQAQQMRRQINSPFMRIYMDNPDFDFDPDFDLDPDVL
ncbi:MAG: tetratricopeptide repeat protein [Chloroflexaceae bacterium]|nr:tetratricopeptide repeat protein [Chloroflexaceae bacterium]